ncbi:hypothetical protein K1X76_04450 [bacterium]|nr:hypothetical protein [bacterium]
MPHLLIVTFLVLLVILLRNFNYLKICQRCKKLNYSLVLWPDKICRHCHQPIFAFKPVNQVLEKTMQGHLELFFEQGMEYEGDWCFVDDSKPTSRDNLWPLSIGDFLTIYDEDKVLWEGWIEPKEKWPYWVQQGVAEDVWRGWFKCKPPLRSVLKRYSNSIH